MRRAPGTGGSPGCRGRPPPSPGTAAPGWRAALGGEEEETEEEEEEKEEKEKEDKDNEAVMLTVDQQIDGPLHLQGPDGRHPVVRHTLKPPRVLPEN